MVPLYLLLPILLTIESGSRSSEVYERVDLIELNHHHDDLGRHAFDQVIFYEWSPDYRRFHVIAWFLVEDQFTRLPRKLSNGDYVVKWQDHDAQVRREIHSRLFRETETSSQVDPERVNKKLFDEKLRASLIHIPQKEVVR